MHAGRATTKNEQQEEGVPIVVLWSIDPLDSPRDRSPARTVFTVCSRSAAACAPLFEAFCASLRAWSASSSACGGRARDEIERSFALEAGRGAASFIAVDAGLFIDVVV